ncbi:MAG: protein-methionine-sulfoxide reductase heme-binding subunit MsrQ [Gammaproteobacteria bacterium]
MSIARIKMLAFLLCLLPVMVLVVQFFQDRLGANPIEAITHETGEWALRFLLITLMATPASRLLGWRWAMRLRRMFGLFAFFYACLHLAIYLWLDQFFDWPEIWLDILDRPFITIGMLAFVLLLPLVVTSTNAMMKRLGKRWKKLHRLAYVIPLLGVLHYWWLVKADVLEPLIYGVVLLVLLMMRTTGLQGMFYKVLPGSR